MTREQALEVSVLLEQNHLMENVSADAVLGSDGSYILELDENGRVLGCVKVIRQSWYQHEICHLARAPDVQGKGIGKRLLERAETRIRAESGLVGQATVCTANTRAIALFERSKYLCSTIFHNPKTGRYLRVYQKPIKTVISEEE